MRSIRPGSTTRTISSSPPRTSSSRSPTDRCSSSTPTGRHRPRADGPRRDAVSSRAEDREGAGADLQRRRRRSTRGSTRRSCAMNPLDFDRSIREPARGAAGRRARSQARATESSARSRRSRSRSISAISSRDAVVAAAGARRFPGRNPHAALRHADLRASAPEAEDISLFDRRRHRNIAVYPSKREAGGARPLLQRGRPRAATTCSTTTSTSTRAPDRQWIDGRATLRLKVAAASARAADAAPRRLARRAVDRQRQFGRLFSLRVKNQNTILVNLPALQPRDKELTLTSRTAAGSSRRRRIARR